MPDFETLLEAACAIMFGVFCGVGCAVCIMLAIDCMKRWRR